MNVHIYVVDINNRSQPFNWVNQLISTFSGYISYTTFKMKKSNIHSFTCFTLRGTSLYPHFWGEWTIYYLQKCLRLVSRRVVVVFLNVKLTSSAKNDVIVWSCACMWWQVFSLSTYNHGKKTEKKQVQCTCGCKQNIFYIVHMYTYIKNVCIYLSFLHHLTATIYTRFTCFSLITKNTTKPPQNVVRGFKAW